MFLITHQILTFSVVRVGSGNFGDYKPTHEKGDPYVSLALIVVSITQRVMRGGDSPR